MASAQPAQAAESWKFLVAPYLMLASMSGTTTVRGFDVDVDASASDIFSNLKFGIMGAMTARKGARFGSDAIWMTLETTPANTNTTVRFSQGAFAFFGLREISPAADVTFGIRVNTLRGSVTFAGPGIAAEQNVTWVDPAVGLALRAPEKGRVRLGVYTEIGGFGAGSDFAWQVFPTVGIRVGSVGSIELGYRWLDVDHTKGEGNERFGYDVLSQGPVFGFAFRF